MLPLTLVRELNLRSADRDRPANLLAASGVVCVGQHLYVVADDELQLGVFKLDEAAPGELLRLFPGELPTEPKRRKKLKPDLEILTRLPACAGLAQQYPQGALLAMGSGALVTRCRAAVMTLASDGALRGVPRSIDASPLFISLMQHFQPLNLEGAWASTDQFCLLQRGNKGDAVNAVVRLSLVEVLNALADGDSLPAIAPLSIRVIDLGDIDGVPLCFTDACAMPDGQCLFTAVAEDVDNAIADGKFLGAAIGLMNVDDQVLWLKRVTPPYKIEGIEARRTHTGWQLLLVTDADDPSIPSLLLTTALKD